LSLLVKSDIRLPVIVDDVGIYLSKVSKNIYNVHKYKFQFKCNANTVQFRVNSRKIILV